MIANFHIGIIALLLCGIILLAFCVGMMEGRRITRNSAITLGFAHFTVNPTNGETRFEWIAQKHQ